MQRFLDQEKREREIAKTREVNEKEGSRSENWKPSCKVSQRERLIEPKSEQKRKVRGTWENENLCATAIEALFWMIGTLECIISKLNLIVPLKLNLFRQTFEN